MQYLDTFEFARLGLETHGETALRSFVRLTAGLQAQPDTAVAWSLAGEHTAPGQLFLRVTAKCVLVLECQRCLAAFEWPVDVQNRLRIVASEADLDVDPHDMHQAENMVESILGSHHFDALALIEDEIILAVPYVPRHEVCPGWPECSPTRQDPSPDEARRLPFAVLGGLKKD